MQQNVHEHILYRVARNLLYVSAFTIEKNAESHSSDKSDNIMFGMPMPTSIRFDDVLV